MRILRNPEIPVVTDDEQDSQDSQEQDNKNKLSLADQADPVDLPVHYDGGENGKIYGDTDWIRQKIKQLPPLMRKQVIETYSTLYQKAYDTELREHVKENAGRFVANNWLRLQIESVLKPRKS